MKTRGLNPLRSTTWNDRDRERVKFRGPSWAEEERPLRTRNRPRFILSNDLMLHTSIRSNFRLEIQILGCMHSDGKSYMSALFYGSFGVQKTLDFSAEDQISGT